MTKISKNQSNLPKAQDPDAYIKSYAAEKGISVKEAKAELKKLYGDPQAPKDDSIFGQIIQEKPDKTQGGSSKKPDYETEVAQFFSDFAISEGGKDGKDSAGTQDADYITAIAEFFSDFAISEGGKDGKDDIPLTGAYQDADSDITASIKKLIEPKGPVRPKGPEREVPYTGKTKKSKKVKNSKKTNNAKTTNKTQKSANKEQSTISKLFSKLFNLN